MSAVLQGVEIADMASCQWTDGTQGVPQIVEKCACFSDVLIKNRTDYKNTEQVRRYLQAVIIGVFYANLYVINLWGGDFTTTLRGNVIAVYKCLVTLAKPFRKLYNLRSLKKTRSQTMILDEKRFNPELHYWFFTIRAVRM